jgi:euchromatic histone-lysine N-methyltransferase
LYHVTLHESAACRDGPSVPAINLQSQKKRPSCVVVKDIEVVIKSAGSSSNALAQSLSEGPSKEHLVSAKMGRAFSGVAPGASDQGAMRREKVMSAAQKEVRPAKLIQKFSKIKVKETEHGKCVTTNGSEDTAGFEHQAPTSWKKCLRTDREAAATSRNSFGPKKKGNAKQKSMLPSNVEDDILKALAAHEEKYGAQNVDAKSKVKMMHGRFEFIRRAIIRAVKQHSLKLPSNRTDLAAADLIKNTPGFTQHGPIVGNVLGIEVGDEFLYRVELNIVGLHRPYQGGIDTTRDKYNVLIAISVVASGGYPDQLSTCGELVYTGSGGKISGKKGVGDQKLENGNLALKNCIRTKTPVRVIHRFKSLNREDGNHSRAKETPMFTYDGLYNVVDCWREGKPGCKVLKYKLQKIPGQAELPYGSETSHRRKARIIG